MGTWSCSVPLESLIAGDLWSRDSVSQQTAIVARWERKMLHTKDEPWRAVGSAWLEVAWRPVSPSVKAPSFCCAPAALASNKGST